MMREIQVATAIALGTATAAGYLWWRWLESARRRKFVRGSSKLPSPMPALPNWFGFVGGHTLVFKLGHVSAAVVLVYVHGLRRHECCGEMSSVMLTLSAGRSASKSGAR